MITYRKDIDGMRSLAVLPVLLFHAGIPGFSGGFVGVDVFFVISGYLITSILLKELSEDRFSIALFYERRARRILPALTAVILFSIVVSHWLGIPTILHGVSRSIIWLCGCSSNLYFKSEFGYFDADANTKPLLHTWSLSVEEQFYIIFPVLLCFGWKFARKWLGLGLSAIVLLSFLASVRGLHRDPSGTFYLLHYRSWELGLGSLLALAFCPQINYRLPQLGSRSSELLSALGLSGILVPLFLYTSETAFPGLAALPPCLGTFLLIWANSERTTLVGAWLSNKVMVTIGLYSYSLYLWHWPLLVFGTLRKGEPLTAWEGAFILGLTCVVAWLSVNFIEKPFREKRLLKQRRPMLLTAGATLSILAAFNWNIVSNYMLYNQQVTSTMLAAPRGISYVIPGLRIWEIEPGIPVYSLGNPQEPGVLLLGDSYANHWLSGLANWAKTKNLSIHMQQIGSVLPLMDATAPAVEKKYQAAWKRRNASYDKLINPLNIKHVILAASWEYYVNPGWSLKEINTVIIGDRVPQSMSEQRELLTLQLEKTIQFFNARGCKVWLMLPTPDYPFNVPLKLASLVRNETPLSTSYMPVHRAEERRRSTCDFLRKTADKFPAAQVGILDPIRYFTQDGYCVTNADGHSLYVDSCHLSHYGSLLAQDVFDSIVTDPAPSTQPQEILAEGATGAKLK